MTPTDPRHLGGEGSSDKRASQRQLPALEIIDPGLQTTVQDYPGRLGLAAKGMFPSGPMDHFAFRAANVLVRNQPGAAALEIPFGQFSAIMLSPVQISLCGAEGANVGVNGKPIPLWEAINVAAGDVLSSHVAAGPGFRLYLALAGGIAVPEVYGSRATYLIGGIGGLDGRALAKGDVIDVYSRETEDASRRRLPFSLRPVLTTTWEIEIVRGPHANPEYLTDEDWADLTSMSWRVDLNSNRVSTRLNPHRFRWARPDGGVAGGHPSNVLDGSYPLGGVLANGDVLTILGPDGNTSGGFAVVATVPHASLWKIGQLRPGRDTVRFREVDLNEALALADHLSFGLQPERFDTIRPPGESAARPPHRSGSRSTRQRDTGGAT